MVIDPLLLVFLVWVSRVKIIFHHVCLLIVSYFLTIGIKARKSSMMLGAMEREFGINSQSRKGCNVIMTHEKMHGMDMCEVLA